MSAAIEIKKEGRRFYLIGNTFQFKDRLRDNGAHWDADRRAWWTSKEEVAVAIFGAAAPASPAVSNGAVRPTETVSTADRVIRGRATYDGKTYYVLAIGESRSTGKRFAKLCFRDGSRVFWAQHPENVQMLKTYEEPTSIDALKRFAERRRAEDAGERACPVCERLCTCGTATFCHHHHDGCDRCGAER